VDRATCTITKTADIPGLGVVQFVVTLGSSFRELRFIASTRALRSAAPPKSVRRSPGWRSRRQDQGRGNSIYVAVSSATAFPWIDSTTDRAISIPAATPADVTIPSSTTRASLYHDCRIEASKEIVRAPMDRGTSPEPATVDQFSRAATRLYRLTWSTAPCGLRSESTREQ
jgi:hypothetical protein